MKSFVMGLIVGVLIVGIVTSAAAVTVSGKFNIFRAADGTNLSAEFYNAYTVIKTISQNPEDYSQEDLHEFTKNVRIALVTLAFKVASADIYKTGKQLQELEL
jgi:hypothetical protein